MFILSTQFQCKKISVVLMCSGSSSVLLFVILLNTKS